MPEFPLPQGHDQPARESYFSEGQATAAVLGELALRACLVRLV